MLKEQELTNKDFDILLEGVSLWEDKGKAELYAFEASQYVSEPLVKKIPEEHYEQVKEYENVVKKKILDLKEHIKIKRDTSIVLKSKLLHKKISIEAQKAIDMLEKDEN